MSMSGIWIVEKNDVRNMDNDVRNMDIDVRNMDIDVRNKDSDVRYMDKKYMSRIWPAFTVHIPDITF